MSFAFDFICALLEYWFFCRFLGRTPRKIILFLFAFIMAFAYSWGYQKEVSLLSFYMIGTIFLLFFLGRTTAQCSNGQGFCAAVLSVTVKGLTDSFFYAISFFLTQWFYQMPQLLLWLSPILILLSCAMLFFAYCLILKYFPMEQMPESNILFILLFPSFLILMVELFIFEDIYGQVVVLDTEIGIVYPIVNNWKIIAINIMSAFSLAVVLYGCQLAVKLVHQEKNEQIIKVQRAYFLEIKRRYEQTRAFRHDIKNHLTTIKRLLDTMQIQPAQSYMTKLSTQCEQISFFSNTSSITLNALLETKLSIAQQKGISIECSVSLPEKLWIEETDLCTIFANAIDNAITACQQTKNEKYLWIKTRFKGDFLLIEFENSCISSEKIKKGIGLNNIHAIAKKYHGEIKIEQEKQKFQLCVLLCNSLQKKDVS